VAGETEIAPTASCVTVTVAAGACPAVNVTVAVRDESEALASTDSVAVPDDEDAGETDSQDADEVADHDPTFVVTLTDREAAAAVGDQDVGETDSIAAAPA
jgi:hypothetical protein